MWLIGNCYDSNPWREPNPKISLLGERASKLKYHTWMTLLSNIGLVTLPPYLKANN